MIIGSVQFKIRILKDLSDFFIHIEELVLEGKRQGADLLVFPEYLSIELVTLLNDWRSMTGDQGEEALKTIGTKFKSQYLNTFLELSKKYNIILSAGTIFYLNETDQKFYNANFLIYPDGIIVEQRKTHTTYELIYNKDIIDKGEELKVTQINGTTIGTLVCYDAGFPENARILMEKGAMVILQPGCVFDKYGANRLRTFASARATENQLFVVNSQICGDLPFPLDNPYHFEAISSIHAPIFPDFQDNNGILVESTPNEESVITARLDFEQLEKVRGSGIPQYLKDRREDFYRRH